MSQCRTSNVHRIVILISLSVILVGLVVSAGAAVVEVPKNGGRESGGKWRIRGTRRKEGKATLLAATVHPDPYPCKPRNISVPLPHPPPGRLYIPNCAVVKRCSGCCSYDAVECLPKPGVKHGVVKWQTNEYVMRPNGQWKFNGLKTFEILEHTKCKCGCKIREEHCNKNSRTTLQRYDRRGCQCFCMNVLERLTCGPPKIWDDSECKCSCPSIECSTGSYIDSDICELHGLRKKAMSAKANVPFSLNGFSAMVKAVTTKLLQLHLNQIKKKHLILQRARVKFYLLRNANLVFIIPEVYRNIRCVSGKEIAERVEM
ncbi:hypothetical protein J437_LFUL000019, partial [Ladona fulva]